MRRRTLGITGALCAWVAAAAAQAPVIRVGEWSVVVPSPLQCAATLTLQVAGPGNLFESGNRGSLDQLAERLASELKPTCQGLTEVILQSGRARRVVTLPAAAVAAPPAVPPPAAVRPATSPEPSSVRPEPVRRPQPEPVQPPTGQPPPPAAMPPTVLAVPAASGDAYANRRLASLSATREIEDKCELLLTWLERSRTDVPVANPGRGPGAGQAAMNLFRDEDFVQLFGVAYDTTTVKWRTDVHEDVIARCQGVPQPQRGLRSFVPRRPLTEFAQRFQPFQAVLDGAFLGRVGAFAPDAITRAVVQARQSKAWMDSAVAGLPRIQATLGSLRALEASRAEGRRQLAALWASEQQHFDLVVTRRKQAIAATLAQNWLADVEQLTPTLDNVRLLVAQRSQNNEVLQNVVDEERDRIAARVNARLDALLSPLVETRLGDLASLPNSMTGLVQAATWYSTFETAFTGVTDRLPVSQGRRQYSETRARMLQGSLEEWRAMVAATELNQAALQTQAVRLNDLFRDPPDRALPVYAEYRQALDRRTDALRQVEAARKAEADRVAAAKLEAERAEAARVAEAARKAEEAELEAARQAELKAATARLAATNAERATRGLPPIKAGCDELAAHPDDPARGAVPGVADALVSGSAAVAACLVAVDANPSSGRLHFQLGRAYWAAREYDEALSEFLVAEEANYAPAYYYLGLAYEQGKGTGEPADLSTASEMYMLAAAEGFRPAIDAYQGIEWDWNVDFTSLANPGLARIVHDFTPGNIPSQQNRREMLGYILGVNNFLTLQPNEYDKSCASIVDPKVTAKLQEMARVATGLTARSSGTMDDLAQIFRRAQSMSFDQVFAQAGENARLETLVQNGTDDIYALVADYGGCSGALVKKFYGNAGALLFEMDGGATSVQRGSLEAACLDDMQQRLPGENHGAYCACIERQYQPVLTSEERARFTADYKVFVKEVIAADPSKKEPTFSWRLYEPQGACRR